MTEQVIWFEEFCDYEGENWVFFLDDTPHNENFVKWLVSSCEQFDTGEEFRFVRKIPRSDAEVLVAYTPMGYMDMFNLLPGELKPIPHEYDLDDYYKGRIENWVQK